MPAKAIEEKIERLLEGAMSKFACTAGIAIAATLLTALYAEVAKSAPRAAGAPHVSVAPHFGDTTSHVGGAPHFDAAPHISYHPTISRPTIHPSFNGSAGTTHGLNHPAFPFGAPAGGAGDATATVPSNAGKMNQMLRIAVHAEDHRVAAVREELSSPKTARTLRDARALRDAHTRALLTAHAATAGWDRARKGWGRHHNGGYGWVGPLFWPFAYYDLYDYALWGDYDDAFWDFGYDDVYSGLFSPYGPDTLAAYLRQTVEGQASASTTPLMQMCGSDSRDIDGLPLNQVEQVIQPTDAQRAALDDLVSASAKAAQTIAAACPTDIALTAPKRLAAMQQRIEAMIAAVKILQPPLDKLYGLLSDEQKARLTALGEDHRSSSSGTLAQNCDATAFTWPSTEIDQMVHPNDAQQQALVALKHASDEAANMLKASCPSAEPLTAPARLAAVANRLDTLLQAIKTVRAALDPLYTSLSDDQKASFDAIGLQQQTSELEPSNTVTKHLRRHVGHVGRIGGIIRHWLPSVR
jgi:hypothetical protein